MKLFSHSVKIKLVVFVKLGANATTATDRQQRGSGLTAIPIICLDLAIGYLRKKTKKIGHTNRMAYSDSARS